MQNILKGLCFENDLPRDEQCFVFVSTSSELWRVGISGKGKHGAAAKGIYTLAVVFWLMILQRLQKGASQAGAVQQLAQGSAGALLGR
jgi:hypothetical protein